MKSFRKELHFHTKTRRAYINITPQVETALAESGVREGLCLVNAMNITASVFINDNESGLHSDFEIWLEKLAPEKPHSQYAHNGYEDNKEPDEQGRRVLKLCDGFTHNFSAVFAAFFAAKIPSRRSFEAFCDGS